ncbi:DNA/RNA non-specific endonuclease [Archangium lansingense]|uniref:DNA/RNA non-specific endonuclease n=1 Tax=Archangium lansingense TaxID=2995310 RepID=A0ABT4AKN8_9BACT|nr:DNA/RNA non-specific endonuclease [Archangium lansinium]MCY1082259.1 DNA/RNA non-specific endonuclease [Archangium lansinium]
MRTLNKLSVAAVFGLVLGGCGATELDLGGEGVASQMEQDFGGPNGLMEFFQSHTEEEIREALKPYGIGYVVRGRVTEEAISDCPKYFPTGDRNIWHNFDGEYYLIDGSGRPSRAYKYLPPISAAARIDSCQLNVGQWGDAENPSNDYDGGHMIGSQLGGWGGRANLVPQDANFNRGNWLQLENKMATCGSLPSGRIRYYIGANYPNSTALVPNNLTMELRNQSSGATVTLSFSNVDYGGSNGTTQRTTGVNWLASQGCN